MLTRRRLVAAAAASLLAAPALAERRVWRLPRAWAPTDLRVTPGHEPGIIHVDLEGTWLYLTLADGWARRYKVAVGARGRNFVGEARVGRMAEWPAWTPTAAMIRAEPEVYGPFAGGLPGGHDSNPLGARALYLYQGRRDTLYRIHGTPQPWLLGQSFSSGCIRLMNEHAVDLYDRVGVGTRVVVA